MKKLLSGFLTAALILGSLAAPMAMAGNNDFVVTGGVSPNQTGIKGDKGWSGTQTFAKPNAYKLIGNGATGITAGTTQTQNGATALTGEVNNVTTVANPYDGVKLPTAVQGLKITVRNSGANILRVWPAASDSLGSMAANLSVDIPVKGQMTFSAIDATIWRYDEKVVIQAPSTQKGSLVIDATDNAGNTVTRITNAAMAAAITLTIPDPGNATASFTLDYSGVSPAGGFTISPRLIHTGATPVTKSTDGTDAVPVVTESYISEMYVPANTTATGAAVFNGSIVGTDKHCVFLFNSSGTQIASTALAGTTTAGADSFQRIAFTAPIALKGPATYYVALQMNGTTDRYNAHAIGNFGASKATGTVFGTLATITPPTTFTANLGPMVSLY